MTPQMEINGIGEEVFEELIHLIISPSGILALAMKKLFLVLVGGKVLFVIAIEVFLR